MNPEKDPKTFLIMILQTISVILIWMLANVFAGIYLGFGFFEIKPDWKNYTYYTLCLASLYLLIKYIMRKWDL